MVKIAFISLVLILASCNKKDDIPDRIEQGLILNQTILVNGTNREYHI